MNNATFRFISRISVVFLAIAIAGVNVVCAEPVLKLPKKAPTPRKTAPAASVPDELLVMAAGGADQEEFNDTIKEAHGTIVRTVGDGPLKVYVVRTEKGKLDETEKKLGKDSNIARVQRNFYARLQQAAPQANDPFFSSQWHLPGMNVPNAWSSATGKNIIIAVLDTGAPVNGVDLSGKTYNGYDAVRGTTRQSPTGDHGALVSTTAAAVTNNRRNTAGVARDSLLYPIKVCDSQGNIKEDAILDAIFHAGSRGIRIINMSINADPPFSFSNPIFHPALHLYADWYHNTVGGLIFIAAGNNGLKDPAPRSSNLIIVNSISRDFFLSDFSTYGNNLWFTAPGEDIFCTNARGRVASVAGTSFSAPNCAAVAALVWSANPSLRNTQVESIMTSTAYKAGNQNFTQWYGFGLPNAAAAVAKAKQ